MFSQHDADLHGATARHFNEWLADPCYACGRPLTDGYCTNEGCRSFCGSDDPCGAEDQPPFEDDPHARQHEEMLVAQELMRRELGGDHDDEEAS